MHWQVEEAQQCFGEVLRAAEAGEPQIVTRHNEEVAVVINIAAYRQLQGEAVGFMAYLRSEPFVDGDVTHDGLSRGDGQTASR